MNIHVGQYALLALQKGVPGALAGGLAGFVLSGAAFIVNQVFISPPDELKYLYKGRLLPYRRLDSIADLQVEDDLRVLARFRYQNPTAHDAGARLVQHIIDANDLFYMERAKKRDGLKALARLQHAAKKADVSFRTLYFAVKDAGDMAGAEEVQQAIGRLHVSFEQLSGAAREDFLLNDQLKGRPAKP
jgi:hypothetical protein